MDYFPKCLACGKDYMTGLCLPRGYCRTCRPDLYAARGPETFQGMTKRYVHQAPRPATFIAAGGLVKVEVTPGAHADGLRQARRFLDGLIEDVHPAQDTSSR